MDDILSEMTVNKIVQRISTELNKEGITSLPEEDINIEQFEKKADAFLQSGHADALIFKNKDEQNN